MQKQNQEDYLQAQRFEEPGRKKILKNDTVQQTYIFSNDVLIMMVILAVAIIAGFYTGYSFGSKDPSHNQIKTQIEPVNPNIGLGRSFVPTLATPNKNTKFNQTVVPLSQMKNYQEALDELFKPYSDTNCNLKRYGDAQQDGGYLLCANTFNNTKAFFNFGIQGRDKLGCDLTKKGLINYQFDCTSERGDQSCNKAGQKQVSVFHKVCVSDRNYFQKQNAYLTLKDILQMKKITPQDHIVLKFDIQSWQWAAFKTLPLQYLSNIDQIVMEVHIFGDEFRSPVWGNIDMIRELKKHFISVNLHTTNFCCYDKTNIVNHFYNSCAIEVSLVNRRLIRVNSQARSYKNHPLNFKNKKSKPDCQFIA